MSTLPRSTLGDRESGMLPPSPSASASASATASATGAAAAAVQPDPADGPESKTSSVSSVSSINAPASRPTTPPAPSSLAPNPGLASADVSPDPAESHVPRLAVGFAPRFPLLAELTDRARREDRAADLKPLALTWSHVTLDAPPKKRSLRDRALRKPKPDPPAPILRDASGRAVGGRVTGLVGPVKSGAGELLGVLGGRDARVRAGATVAIDGVDALARPVAYRSVVATIPLDPAAQYAFSTVRDAVAFSAELRAPAFVSRDERAALVEELLAGMGLVEVAGKVLKDVEPDERRRVGIAVELASVPYAILAHEPDAAATPVGAWRTMRALAGVAKATGIVVLVALKDPASEVFSALDDVALVSRGAVVYRGPRDEMAKALARRGMHVPHELSLVDYASLVAAVSELPAWDEDADEETVTKLPASSKASSFAALDDRGPDAAHLRADGADGVPPSRRSRSILTQFRALLRREIKAVPHNPNVFKMRLISGIFLAVLIALFFAHRADQTLSNYGVSGHFGSLMLVLFSSPIAAGSQSASALGSERAAFLRERTARAYSSVPWIVAKTIVELPIQALVAVVLVAVAHHAVEWKGSLGLQIGLAFAVMECAYSYGYACVGYARTTGAASMMATLLIALQILFIGTFVPVNALPEFLGTWAPYLCFIKYAINVAILDELPLTICRTPTICAQWAGMRVTIAIDPNLYTVYGAVLVVFFVAVRALAVVLMERKVVKVRSRGVVEA